jgi:hypothetical protein
MSDETFATRFAMAKRERSPVRQIAGGAPAKGMLVATTASCRPRSAAKSRADEKADEPRHRPIRPRSDRKVREIRTRTIWPK